MLAVAGETGTASTLANHTIIEAFTAQPATHRTQEPSPLEPERLPKHVRYRCATPRRSPCTDKGTQRASIATPESLRRSLRTRLALVRLIRALLE